MEQDKIYVGIDVSQDSLDVASYPTGKAGQYANNKSGIAGLVAMLQKMNPTLIVMEATGGLESALKDALDGAGLAAAVVNPKRIRDYGRALGILAKTDKLDAQVIAHFAARIEPAAQPPRDKTARELESLITRRNQLADMLIAERNRLREHLEPAVQAEIKEHISWLEEKIKERDKEIKEKIRLNPVFRKKAKLYQSMKGVGPVLSSTLIAKLPQLGVLSQREIAALVGLAPVNKDSGKFRGRRMIQGGKAMVRKAIYMPVLAALRFNPVIRELYHRLIARGKLAKVALVACMHKMLTILNAMAKTNTPWHYDYVKA